MTTNGAVTAKKRPRFADGGQTRLPLSDGDWVAVRKELTYGQQRRLAAAGLSGVPNALAARGEGQALTIDLAQYDIERLVTWILDWSLTGADGEPVYVSREAIESLHPDTAKEIQDALDRYVETLEGKKDPTGGSASAATSPSARSSAGAGRR